MTQSAPSFNTQSRQARLNISVDFVRWSSLWHHHFRSIFIHSIPPVCERILAELVRHKCQRLAELYKLVPSALFIEVANAFPATGDSHTDPSHCIWSMAVTTLFHRCGARMARSISRRSSYRSLRHHHQTERKSRIQPVWKHPSGGAELRYWQVSGCAGGGWLDLLTACHHPRA